MNLTKNHFALLALFITALGACHRAPEQQSVATTPEQQPIVGQWYEVGGNDKIEFHPGRLFVARMAPPRSDGTSLRYLTGVYSVTGNGDRIQIHLKNAGPDGSLDWRIKQSDEDLFVTYAIGGSVKEDGTFAKFHRIKASQWGSETSVALRKGPRANDNEPP